MDDRTLVARKPARRVGAADALPPELNGGVIAIGNFDGVHRGHQSVLDRARAVADQSGRAAVVLTFEPHPRTFFRPDAPVFRLTPAPVKAKLLGLLGFDAVVECRFDAAFADLGAEAFVSDILSRRLGATHVVTGFDFHFGKGREGGPAYLMDAGERQGFAVTLVDAFRDENAEVVSSSRIRRKLAEGDVTGAAGLLGHRFLLEGEVITGKKLGRTLGFPTANMALSPGTDLKSGIYAVRFRRADGSLHDGVASFGHRPTVDIDGAPLLETFLFDFEGDLYGETSTVSFFGYLRAEEKFDGLAALVEQMKRDEAEARALLAGVAPLGAVDAALNF
jgi:riboflavin kinase / FMN adenylyltransferase